MNIHWIGIALIATLVSTTLPSAAFAQETARAPAHPKNQDTPCTPDDGCALKQACFPRGGGKQAGDLPGQTPRGYSEAERAAWRLALVQTDLDHRFSAYLALVERAASDPLVEKLLTDWAHEAGEPELAWSARLGLREARSMRIRNRRGARRYNDLFAGLSVHIADVPQGVIVAGPRDSAPGARNGRSSSRILRLQTGPAGVRVEVLDASAGGGAKVFEAADLGQLLEQHPELAADLAGVRLVPELADDLGARMEFSFGALWSGDAGLLRTDILGIQMREQRLDALDSVDGRPTIGLLVERIVPDTIAQVIALKRGDLLLELNTVAVECGDDVSRIIEEREAAGAITVKVERDGVLRTLTWKPTIAGDAKPGVPVDPPKPAAPVTGGE